MPFSFYTEKIIFYFIQYFLIRFDIIGEAARAPALFESFAFSANYLLSFLYHSSTLSATYPEKLSKLSHLQF